MHLAKNFFLKKYHPISYSPGFSGHDGRLRNVLGLVCLYCEFFENGRGPLKISVGNLEDAPGRPRPKSTAARLSSSDPSRVISDLVGEHFIH